MKSERIRNFFKPTQLLHHQNVLNIVRHEQEIHFMVLCLSCRSRKNMNLSNSSLLDHSYPPQSTSPSPTVMLFLILQQCVFILSFSGNLIVIIVVLKYLKLNTFSNRMVVSLAVTDLCTGFASGSQLLYFLFPQMDQNKVSCFLRYRIVSIMTTASQSSLMFSTLDRFVAIHRPHHYQNIMTKPLGISFIILAWSFSIGTGILPFLVQNDWSDLQFCFYHIVFDKYIYLIDSISFYTLMISSFVLNIIILKTAWSFINRVQPAFETSRNRQKTVRMKSDVNSAKVWGLVTLFNSVCWAPFTTFPLGIGLGVSYSLSELLTMNWLVFLGMLNSIMNPFIFAWHRQDFNKALKKLLRVRENRVNHAVHVNVIQLRQRNKTSQSENGCGTSSSQTRK